MEESQQTESHSTDEAAGNHDSVPDVTGDHDQRVYGPPIEPTNASGDGSLQSGQVMRSATVMDPALHSDCVSYSPFYDAETGLSGDGPLQNVHYQDTGITAISRNSSRVYSVLSNPPSAGHLSATSPDAAFPLPTTPLLVPHEAKLMQHFIEHLAPSIDICNQDQAFGRLVPRMAFLSPVLLTSIFAAAAKHTSKTGEPTNPTAEQYFQECLDHLIPMLNDPEAVVEDYLLAAVVILRVMEEMDSKCVSLSTLILLLMLY